MAGRSASAPSQSPGTRRQRPREAAAHARPRRRVDGSKPPRTRKGAIARPRCGNTTPRAVRHERTHENVTMAGDGRAKRLSPQPLTPQPHATRPAGCHRRRPGHKPTTRARPWKTKTKSDRPPGHKEKGWNNSTPCCLDDTPKQDSHLARLAHHGKPTTARGTKADNPQGPTECGAGRSPGVPHPEASCRAPGKSERLYYNNEASRTATRGTGRPE